MSESLVSRLERTLRTVPDFPIPGIQFKDITPLLANAALFAEVIGAMTAPFTSMRISHVVGVESRGFLFGVPVAMSLGAAFVPVRKPGKLPWETFRESFSLEYGADVLEIHVDALPRDSRVLLVDDILATGGTMAATCRLVERTGATVAGISILGEIAGLCSPELLAGRTVCAVLSL